MADHPLNHQPRTNPTSSFVRRELLKELEEKKAKGLCFRCNEKYTMGHQCKKKQLYVMEGEQEDSDRETSQEEDNEEEV